MSWRYIAYGLSIQSEIALPELGQPVAICATGCPLPDIRIHRGRCPPRPDDSAGDDRTWISSDQACFHYPETGSFHMLAGREVIIDALETAADCELRLILLGPVLAVLLHQRGLLVLHASANRVQTARGPVAICFLGDKGAGKSTTAAAMHARGHGLVSDDLVAVDFAAGRPMVRPGFPHLKLWPEAAATTLDDANSAAALPKLHRDFEKRSRSVAGQFPRDPMPLAAVYVLAYGERHSIDPASGQSSFMHLVHHSYLGQVLQATGTQKSHFQQVTRLLSAVPVRHLVRPRDLSGIQGMIETIQRDLAA